MQKAKFDIQGMTCSSCSSHVEKAVSKLNGIKEVNVNLLSNSMDVLFDENIVNDKEIINSVIEAGYGASLYLEKNKKSNKSNTILDDNENIKNMKRRLILSICFLIPLMYVAMHHMLNKLIGLPIPEIINNLFHGTKNSLIFAFTQFLLVLPIVYLNRNYFIIRI